MAGSKRKAATKGWTTVRVTTQVHTVLKKLSSTHGHRLEVFAVAMLQYATIKNDRVNAALAEYQDRASKVCEDRHEREGPPDYGPFESDEGTTA